MLLEQMLLRSDFTLTRALGDPQAAAEAGEPLATYALWGRASQARFDGSQDGVSLNGDVVTGLFGADYARGDWLAGLSLAHSEGRGRYSGDAVPGGRIETSLTALTPYGHLRLADGRSVWGVVGVGKGALNLRPDGDSARQADLGWQMAALGGRDELLRLPMLNNFALAAKADLLWTRTASDAVAGLAGAAAETARLRAALEGSWNLSLGRFGEVSQRLEAGLRHDSGDAEAGWGLEVGGGLSWQHAAAGLDLAIETRGLASHQDSAFRLMGHSVSLGWDARPDSERGLSLKLSQDSGGAGGGVQALFSPGPSGSDAFRDSGLSERRWSAEAAWGLPMFGERFIGAPYLNHNWSGNGGDTTLGWRLSPAADGALQIRIDFQATHRASGAYGGFGGAYADYAFNANQPPGLEESTDSGVGGDMEFGLKIEVRF